MDLLGPMIVHLNLIQFYNKIDYNLTLQNGLYNFVNSTNSECGCLFIHSLTSNGILSP